MRIITLFCLLLALVFLDLSFGRYIKNEGASELEKIICFQNRTGEQCLCC
jgi:hypothetical protein